MLRRKILVHILIIQTVVLALFVGAYVYIYQNHNAIEQQSLTTDLERVKTALQQETRQLASYNREWAASGLFYYAFRDNQPTNVWLRRVYMASLVGGFGIDYGAVFDTQGQLLTARHKLTNRQAEFDIDRDSAFIATLANYPGLLQHPHNNHQRNGLLVMDGEILLVSSEPITMGGYGPGVHGTLVAASYFDEEALNQLQALVLQDLTITPLAQLTTPPLANQSGLAEIAQQLLNSRTNVIHRPGDQDTIRSYTLLNDVSGEPRFLLSTGAQRQLMNQVKNTIATTSIGLFISLLLLAGYVLIFLDKAILQRLKHISQGVTQLSQSRDVSQRLPGYQRDELGILTNNFNQLLDTLQDMQQSLTAERDKAETTLASIGDAVITTDRSGRIQYLNQAAQRITQQHSDECRGLNLEAVFNPADEQGAQSPINLARRCLAANKPMRDNTYSRLCNALGEEVLVESLACPIRDGAGAATGAVIAFRDVTQSRKLQQHLAHQAAHDSLTGLYNRAEFEQQMQLLSKPQEQNEQQHFLLFIDLDRFKLVNDNCGHTAGDQLLVEIGRLMQSVIRRSDILARIGGDEFGVLLVNCEKSHALNIAEKIRQAVEAFRFTYDGQLFSLGASIGMVSLREQERHPDLSLLSLADSACMSAKRSGRNRVQQFHGKDSNLNAQREQNQWVNRITEALQQDGFELYFQKLASHKDNRESLSSAEVLLRMLDAQGAPISPGAFLPAAERYGLMKAIDQWVVENFCQWASQHPEIFDSVSQFSINLSGQSLSDKDFLNYLVNYFKQPLVNPQRICFEITETAAVQNMANAQNFITTLRLMGFSFALDDFGSGMSSFGYLKHLPIDSLKIDGIFVRNITQEPIDYSMVRSMHELGRALNIKTVAEFVENQEIYDMLMELGVDYLQGYHIHKPEPLRHLFRPTLSTGNPDSNAAITH